MVRIRFDTSSFYKITKEVKTNLVDKIAHLGGTFGLFNGFTAIALFEFIPFGIALFIQQYNAWKNKGELSNGSKVEVFQSNENNKANYDIKKKLDAMIPIIETIQKKVDTSERDIKKLVEINVLKDIINKKNYKK